MGEGGTISSKQQDAPSAVLREGDATLRQAEQRYAELYAALPVAAFVCNRDAVIQNYNPRAAELWKREPETGVERHCGSVKLWLPDGTHLPHAQSPMMEVLRTGTECRSVQISIERPDGSRLPVIANFCPLKDVHGQVTGVLTTFDDMSERKQAQNLAVEQSNLLERASAESERQRRLYETVLSNTPDLLYVFALDHRFVYANAALLDMWGLSWNDAIGKTCLELGYEPWHAAMHDREIEQVIATRQPVRGEVPFTGTHGRRIYEYIFVPVLDADGEVEAIAGATRDTTERKLGEEALIESERRLTEVFQTAPAFMAVLRGPQMVFEKANAAYFKVVGERKALLGKPLLEAIPEIADQPFPALIRGVMETGEAFHGTNVRALLKRSDDRPLEEIWVDFVFEPLRELDGTVSGVLVHGIDLTERVAVEESLRQSRAALEFTLESSQIGDWDLDLTTDTSRRSLRHDQCFGYTTPIPDAEWGFETFIRHVHPDDREEIAREFHAALTGHKEWHFECRVVWPDGSIHWIATHGSLYRARGDENKPSRMLGIVVDITECKHGEEIIRRSVDEMRNLTAELSDAARRKDEFLATLAHELRNPLAPISNALQILRLADRKPEVVRTVFPVMERQVGQLVRLVDDLLDVSRISRGRLDLRRERIDLGSAIDDAVDASRPLIERMEHTLTVALPPEPLSVEADPTRLAQILGNLLTNACKFTDPRGRIAVTVERDDQCAVIRVKDNGIGIAADQLGRVFEPFTQLDVSLERSVSGLGIGLSLVKSLVEKHGGTVEVESAGAGQGSQFTVRLPCDG